MKKLLVLALVCGIASLATAGLATKGVGMSIVDNGDGTFGIFSDTGFAAGQDIYFAAVSDGVKPVGGALVVAYPDFAIWDNAIGDGYIPVANDGVWGFVGDTGGAARAGGLWFDGIASAIGSTIYLYEVDGNSWALGNLMDTVTLVPEPATMALLGLGALVLRRRK